MDPKNEDLKELGLSLEKIIYLKSFYIGAAQVLMPAILTFQCINYIWSGII